MTRSTTKSARGPLSRCRRPASAQDSAFDSFPSRVSRNLAPNNVYLWQGKKASMKALNLIEAVVGKRDHKMIKQGVSSFRQIRIVFEQRL